MTKLAFSGHFRLEVRNAATNELKSVCEFDNLITNKGLNSYGLGITTNLSYCYIGQGTNTPSIYDATLGQYVAATRWTSSSKIAPVAPDYVSGVVLTYRFNAGSVVGNFSEIGIGSVNGVPSSGHLWSRALILDEYGNPSTISVQANEYLDVYYTLYLHPPLTEEKQFTVTINNITHTVTAKLAKITDSGVWEGLSAKGVVFPKGCLTRVNTNSTALGDITGTINGVQTDTSVGGYPYNPVGTPNPYVEGTFKRSTTFHFGLPNDNYENGISGLEFHTLERIVDTEQGFRMYFQFFINPPIMKTNKQELDLTFEYSWGRYE